MVTYCSKNSDMSREVYNVRLLGVQGLRVCVRILLDLGDTLGSLWGVVEANIRAQSDDVL